YHGTKRSPPCGGARADRRAHGKARAPGPESSRRDPRHHSGRSPRRHRAACLRRQGALRPPLAGENRRPQEGVRARPGRRGQPPPPRATGAATKEEDMTSLLALRISLALVLGGQALAYVVGSGGHVPIAHAVVAAVEVVGAVLLLSRWRRIGAAMV